MLTMKIFQSQDKGTNDGFGIAGKKIRQSIERVHGPMVPIEEAEVNLNFTHPHHGRYTDSAYDIMYLPWESTEPLTGWKQHLEGFQEVWVTSPWLQGVVKDWGFDSFVYEHGVDPIWSPKPQNKPLEGPFTFLMIGFEAYRKGGLEALRGFRRAFGNDPDVKLIIKTKVTGLGNVYPNVRFISEDLTLEQLIDLYRSAHVVLAPSYGEGFGIPSRDAMAMGKPLIHTAGFAPYEDLMHSDLIIPSKLIDSPWPVPHPGQVFEPNIDSLVEIIKSVYENYDLYEWHAMETSTKIHERYNWDNITRQIFFALEKRI